MTRIIGGRAGGRRIRTPRGDATRPTSDRVREALFSVLEARLGSWHGLAFLDLYAGSGAVGLEAASRGAGPVTLVEQDRRTAALVRRNADDLGLPVTVVTAAVDRFLGGTPADRLLDVAFLDPPYPMAAETVAADLVALADHWLAPEALVVVERSARDRGWTWPAAYVEAGRRTYGETVLHLATVVRSRAAPSPDAG